LNVSRTWQCAARLERKRTGAGTQRAGPFSLPQNARLRLLGG
jgi:hypothetical protein